MATLNPNDTVFTWAGIPIQGAMDNEFFTAARRNAAVMLHVGAQGFTTYVESADESGTIKAVLSMKSPTNALLSAAFNAKLVGVAQMEDLDDKTLVLGANARIENHAEIKRGKEVVGMEWTWLVPVLKMAAGGSTE